MPYGTFLLSSFSLWAGVLLLFFAVFGGVLKIGGFRCETPGIFNRIRELRTRKHPLEKGTPSDAP